MMVACPSSSGTVSTGKVVPAATAYLYLLRRHT